MVYGLHENMAMSTVKRTHVDVVTCLRQLMNRQLRMLEFVHDKLLEYLDKYLHHILLQYYKCSLWK